MAKRTRTEPVNIALYEKAWTAVAPTKKRKPSKKKTRRKTKEKRK
jgi:hypothetical protein